jgi:DNA-directed RNA polymerase alpha subunit
LATLEAVGVTTIWHLIHCPEFDLTSLKFVGKKTMEKINQQLAQRGWSIGMTVVTEEPR